MFKEEIYLNRCPTVRHSSKSLVVSTALAFCICYAGAAVSGTILQPSAVSTSGGDHLPPTLLIDQSGLSNSYINGLTDFDAYIASNPTHLNNGPPPVMWSSPFFRVSQPHITFDLGSIKTIESMAIWNRTVGFGNQGIRDFNLVISPDASFTSSISLGVFTALNELGTLEATEAQVIGFSPVSAAFIRMEVLSIYAPMPFGSMSMSEVVFEEFASIAPPASIPEADTFMIFSVGLFGLAWVNRRRTKRKFLSLCQNIDHQKIR